MNLEINIVKNKINSYFGEKKEYIKDQRELEIKRTDMIMQRMQENLGKLVFTLNTQLKRPTNEV